MFDASKTNPKKTQSGFMWIKRRLYFQLHRHVIGEIIPFNRFSIWNQRDSFWNRFTNVFYFQISCQIEIALDAWKVCDWWNMIKPFEIHFSTAKGTNHSIGDRFLRNNYFLRRFEQWTCSVKNFQPNSVFWNWKRKKGNKNRIFNRNLYHLKWTIFTPDDNPTNNSYQLSSINSCQVPASRLNDN